MSVRLDHCCFSLNSSLPLIQLCCKSWELSGNCTFVPRSKSSKVQNSDHSRLKSLQMWYAPALSLLWVSLNRFLLIIQTVQIQPPSLFHLWFITNVLNRKWPSKGGIPSCRPCLLFWFGIRGSIHKLVARYYQLQGLCGGRVQCSFESPFICADWKPSVVSWCLFVIRR